MPDLKSDLFRETYENAPFTARFFRRIIQTYSFFSDPSQQGGRNDGGRYKAPAGISVLSMMINRWKRTAFRCRRGVHLPDEFDRRSFSAFAKRPFQNVKLLFRKSGKVFKIFRRMKSTSVAIRKSGGLEGFVRSAVSIRQIRRGRGGGGGNRP